MDFGPIVHTIVMVVAFLSGAYVVFVTAQKADGVLKPIGTALAVLLVLAAALFIVGHLSGKMGGAHAHAADKPAAADTATPGK